MNLKLPVDVHLAISDDGSVALLVGGLDVGIKLTDLPAVMAGKPIRQGPRTARMVKKKPPQPMCRYGDAKAMKGKKLCSKHQAIAARSAAKARAAKKKAVAA